VVRYSKDLDKRQTLSLALIIELIWDELDGKFRLSVEGTANQEEGSLPCGKSHCLKSEQIG
jgi:hypothetical protein